MDVCRIFSYFVDLCNERKNMTIKIYRTIILPVILNGCETAYLTMRDEHRVRLTENRVLRRIFGS